MLKSFPMVVSETESGHSNTFTVITWSDKLCPDQNYTGSHSHAPGMIEGIDSALCCYNGERQHDHKAQSYNTHKD